MREFIHITIMKLAIWSIRRGYGANCPTKDTDDFPELKESLCGSCQAKEIIEWLEERIGLIKGEW